MDLHQAGSAIAQAQQFGVASKPQTLLLAAPTGSGKTVIMTAVIEALLQGTSQVPPIGDAIVLWVSDDPELNRQTGARIARYSELTASQQPLEVEDGSFDHATFPPGRVWLLNTQKLGRASNLTKEAGDKRRWTIWETIQNTADQYPDRFFVFIDEAHRGANTDKNRDTILQELVCGGTRLRAPGLPIVIGLSATPQRFTSLAAGVGRASNPTVIDVAKVRSSGLLKECVVVHCPKHRTAADATLLGRAAARWAEMTRLWNDYAAATPGVAVRPAFIVQVGDNQDESRQDTAQIEATVRAVRMVSPVADRGFVHTFQSRAPIKLSDGTIIRWAAASTIDQDLDALVVFFKTRLITGWDCPRAEVMFSFRGSSDVDTITQLVGRLIRTPLGTNVRTNDILNQVFLYLPSYDRGAVNAVLQRIKDPDATEGVGTDARHADETVETLPATEVTLVECQRVLAKLPSYDIPAARRTPDHKRLVALGALLATTQPTGSTEPLLADGRTVALGLLTNKLMALATELEEGEAIASGTVHVHQLTQSLKGAAKLIDVGADESLSDADIDRALEHAIRIVNGDLITLFRRRRFDALVSDAEGRDAGVGKDADESRPNAHRQTKLELLTILRKGNTWAQLEAEAAVLLDAWRAAHYQPVVEKLSPEARAAFEDIWAATGEPTLRSPRSIAGNKDLRITYTSGDHPLEKHLFHEALAADTPEAPLALFDSPDGQRRGIALGSAWEDIALANVLGAGAVAWFRNPPRHEVSICIPYRDDAWKGCYPDLIVFRRVNGQLVADLVDPHAHTLPDAVAKAKGLADHVAKHPHAYNRVIMLSKIKGVLRALDLTQQGVRTKILALSSGASHLAELYETHGTPVSQQQ